MAEEVVGELGELIGDAAKALRARLKELVPGMGSRASDDRAQDMSPAMRHDVKLSSSKGSR
jgi:hypothetical protein